MNFSETLRKLMDNRGLSNYELAKKLDVHPTTIANWLEGKEPRKKTLVQVAEYFNVSVDYLLGHQTEQPATPEDDEPIIILNRGVRKLTPEQRRQLLDVAKIMFEKEFKND